MQYTVEELYTKKEDQTYDRKSARKDPKGLSNHIVAFANADGGTLVIGIEDNFEVTGIDDYQNNVNDILRVPFDYCKPSIRVSTETVKCIDKKGSRGDNPTLLDAFHKLYHILVISDLKRMVGEIVNQLKGNIPDFAELGIVPKLLRREQFIERR